MKQLNNLTILGIETSCDDTAVAILEASGIKNPRFKILSNIVSSQVKLHAKYGGVYPMLAKREHQRNLPIVLNKALRRAGFVNIKYQKSKIKKNPNIDLIAVTVGPGLEPCLWQGINFAKALSHYWGIPVVPVNHIEAHIIANFVGENQSSRLRQGCPLRRSSFGYEGRVGGQAKLPPSPRLRRASKNQNLFPAICLVVSGGHTQIILMANFGKYKILGETRDDAAGECFDKTARILGLGYPGGPAIAAEAARHKPKAISYKPSLPRPMIYHKNYDFSFSGLKTAVLYEFTNKPKKIQKSKEYIGAMAVEIQQAIIDVLIYKTIKAAKDFKAKSIILGGGVSANEELRKQFRETIKKETPNAFYLMPDISFCTDNAAMIAATAYFERSEKQGFRPRRSSYFDPPVGGEKQGSARRAGSYFHWQKNKSANKEISADANLAIE